MFDGISLVGSHRKQVAVSSHGLCEKQGLVVCHPFYLLHPFGAFGKDVSDKFSFHITHEKGSPAYKTQFLPVRRNIEGGYLSLNVKILVLGEGIVPVDVEFDFIGFARLHIVDPELVILFKDYRPSVCIDERGLDRSWKLGECRFLSIREGVEIVFVVALIRDKVKISFSVHRGGKIFTWPSSVTGIFFCRGIVRLDIRVIGSLVALALCLVAAFPGVVEENFACQRMFHQVVVVLEEVFAKNPDGGTSFNSNFKPGSQSCPAAGEVDGLAVPTPAVYLVGTAVKG